MKRLIALMLTAVMTLCLFAGCGTTATESKTFKIVTTIYPVYNWLQNITDGAENVELTLLVEDGKDIHNYQPTAEDMVKISDCNYFVYVGGESDKWVNDSAAAFFKDNDGKYKVSLLGLLGDYAKDEELVEGMQAEEEEDDDGAYDEHVWLSVKNAELFCRELAAGLKTADSANADVYEKNEKTYQEKLKALDDKHTDALVKSDKKYDTLLFGDRFPFRYLVDDYKLKYYAAFAGCSADSEASFETVAFLADKLTELELPAVLTIDGSDGKLAETIIETSDNKTAQILQLNSMQAVSKEMIDSGDDYIGMMEKNLDVLKTALAVGK